MKSRNEFTTKEEYNEYLRIYFAGLAMQGLIAGRWACPDNVPNDVETIVKQAVIHADQLLKQLETSNKENQDDRN